jgi:hypothetical protein
MDSHEGGNSSGCLLQRSRSCLLVKCRHEGANQRISVEEAVKIGTINGAHVVNGFMRAENKM